MGYRVARDTVPGGTSPLVRYVLFIFVSLYRPLKPLPSYFGKAIHMLKLLLRYPMARESPRE